MSNLYELTGNFIKIQQLIEEGADAEIFTDTLASIEGAVEEKALGYFYVIKNTEADVEALKAEEKRLADKRKAAENKIQSLKGNLEYSMKEMNIPKIKHTLFTANIQKNAPSLFIEQEDKIPRSYYVEQEPKLDRKELLQAVKAGEVPGVTLRQTESLRLR